MKAIKTFPLLRNKYAVYLVMLVLIGLGFLNGQIIFKSPQQTKYDWLNTGDWTHFSGAEKSDNGIKITHTSRVINHRDTSTAQPNPPLNLYGPHMKVHGEFRINTEISGTDNEATLQFYGQVPIIYDEWRQERPSLRLIISSQQIQLKVWDGSGSLSMDERTFELASNNKIKLSLLSKNGYIVVQANGKELGSIPDHNIFQDGNIWFGADAKYGTSGWTLHKLTVQGEGEDDVELSQPIELKGLIGDPNSLKNLSAVHPRNLPIGTAVAIGPLLTDKKYRDIFLGQFNMMTPENSFKPQFIHPQKDLYLFEDTDILVETAKNNQMSIHGHALVMGKANPEWMQKTPNEERQQIMTDHINHVMGRYKGLVSQWDVVNEPLSEDSVDYSESQKGMRKQLWFDAMGEEYIDIAFKAARAADPKAKLYINDFGIENDGIRWDALLNLVKRLQSRGVPLDGVGFESHVYHAPADTINPDMLKQHIKILASLGIESRISEIDVLGDNPEFQAAQYSDVLKACLSEISCTSYSTWGITDLYGSTTLSDRYLINLGDSLLWDKEYSPKPALRHLQEALSP